MDLYLATEHGGFTVDIDTVLYSELHGKCVTFVFKNPDHTDKTFVYDNAANALNEYTDFALLMAAYNQAKIHQCLR